MTHATPGRRRNADTQVAASTTEINFSDPAQYDRPVQYGTAWSSAGADELIADMYRAHGLALIRVALMLVGDRATAEDVVQDAFVGLYRSLHRLSSADKAHAYLRASVVNGCRSVHRRRATIRRHRQHEPAIWSAESAVMAREDSRLALQAVSRLPSRAREVLALRYYLDMPDREIAAALGVSRSTVSSTASRALAWLAQTLRDEL
jgi:RNA polymerase sigma factor (sigma-70 family)